MDKKELKLKQIENEDSAVVRIKHNADEESLVLHYHKVLHNHYTINILADLIKKFFEKIKTAEKILDGKGEGYEVQDYQITIISFKFGKQVINMSYQQKEEYIIGNYLDVEHLEFKYKEKYTCKKMSKADKEQVNEAELKDQYEKQLSQIVKEGMEYDLLQKKETQEYIKKYHLEVEKVQSSHRKESHESQRHENGFKHEKEDKVDMNRFEDIQLVEKDNDNKIHLKKRIIQSPKNIQKQKHKKEKQNASCCFSCRKLL